MQIKLLALSAFACLSTFAFAAPTSSPDTTLAPTPAEQKIKDIMQSPDVQNVVEYFINVVIAEFQKDSS
ncbi:hypothetical protein G6F60_001748 [Rhizopus arrhizus]|nr:hypothetical protein G6F60_001748 [Rhizopus arrhizus]